MNRSTQTQGTRPGELVADASVAVVEVGRGLHVLGPKLGGGFRLISKSILARDMIQKGRMGGDQFETSVAADQQMTDRSLGTDRRKEPGGSP